MVIASALAFGDFSMWYSVHRGDFVDPQGPATFFGLVGMFTVIIEGLILVLGLVLFFEEGGWLEQLLQRVNDNSEREKRQIEKMRGPIGRFLRDIEADYAPQEPPRGEWRRE